MVVTEELEARLEQPAVKVATLLCKGAAVLLSLAPVLEDRDVTQLLRGDGELPPTFLLPKAEPLNRLKLRVVRRLESPRPTITGWSMVEPDYGIEEIGRTVVEPLEESLDLLDLLLVLHLLEAQHDNSLQ